MLDTNVIEIETALTNRNAPMIIVSLNPFQMVNVNHITMISVEKGKHDTINLEILLVRGGVTLYNVTEEEIVELTQKIATKLSELCKMI